MRTAARALRDSIPDAERGAAAERVAAIGLDFLKVPPSTVAAYFPVRGELDCVALMGRLAAEGWRTALPVTGEGGPLGFRTWAPGAALKEGRFRVPEPANGDAVTPAVLLVPLLAFDARGYRLGYGRGDYDRTLAVLRASGEPIAIGLAFDTQEVAEVPADTHDEKLDWMLTPPGARRCGSG
jgi:5-formyltetrahydrofolate cyclo-ligase